MRSRAALCTLAVALLQRLARAHGDEPPAMDAANDTTTVAAMSSMPMPVAGTPAGRPMVMKDLEDFPYFESYFLHADYSGIVLLHIGLMTLAWAIVLPLVVMLSVGRSRLTLPAQLLFLALNAAGVVVSCVYNYGTPDLYPNNAHHTVGWVVTWAAAAWVCLGFLSRFVGSDSHRNERGDPAQTSTITHQVMAEYQRLEASSGPLRWSHDSGHGTDRNTASLASSSRSNSWDTSQGDLPTAGKPQAADMDDVNFHDDDEEKRGFLGAARVGRPSGPHASLLANRTMCGLIHFSSFFLERTILILAYLALVTGFVTYSGIGRGNHVFNILAHLIKGSIFFWYGLATFGRWMGSWADIGWAWNIRPGADVVGAAKAKLPSAEFTESFVIFIYGASNVFLEHLGAWGKAWAPMDFEHVSITIMFFGGGLLGMLIESKRVRNMLSSSLGAGNGDDDFAHARPAEWRQPDSYVHPLNPIPALVILLLGIMMTGHTQHSLVSGEIHRQWGLLFAGFALSRILTYASLWLKPPMSHLASRPPTELLAAFCLVSGGLVFMASNKDTINAIEDYGLDSMFVFTVVMGWSCLVMAWALFAVAVKGWAVRRSGALSNRIAIPQSP